MKVSVIIPVYNTADFLKRCIDSIIAQTYVDLEIILVNDGSTDNSSSICKEYCKKDNRIVYIEKENGGLSSARNAGLDVFTGEYVCFVDSDDCVSPFYVEKMVAMCLENDTLISVCGYWTNNYTSLPEQVPYPHMVYKTEIIDQKDFYLRIYSPQEIIYVICCNKLFHRIIFYKYRFAVGKISEDEGIIHYLISCTDKIPVNYEPLYFYTIRSGSITQVDGFKPNRLDVLSFLIEREKLFLSMRYYDLVFLTQKKYLVKCLELYNLIDENTTDGKMYKKRIIKLYKTMLKKAFSNPVKSRKFLLKMIKYAFAPQKFKGIDGHTFLYGEQNG